MKNDIIGYCIIAIFSLLGLALVYSGYRQKGKGLRFLGVPAIPAGIFWFGKISVFTSWGLFLAKAINPGFTVFVSFTGLSLAALLVLLSGAIIMSYAFFDLGASLKVGLPDQETALKTGGIYRLSRNPIYLGLILITLASCLYFPDPLNIILAVTGIIIHHLITLSEEKFLRQRFGKEYEDYCKKVRRYL